MCGIAGILARSPERRWSQLGRQMLAALVHRGPDDWGIVGLRSWGEPEFFCADQDNRDGPAEPAVLLLGNRRLSILDLSPAGHQPMTTDGRHLWIVYNGEVYNYVELRSELSSFGYRFHSGTDTEVILRAYQHWGADCFRRFNGMWALAIWDQAKRQLVLSRDHLGIKPLYYTQQADHVVFASEIRALLLDHHLSREPNLRAIFEYLAQRTCDTGLETFFTGVHRVPAAGYVVFDVSREQGPLTPRPEIFWRLQAQPEAPGTASERAEHLRFLLEDAIRLRLRSDVPVGVCLSGGLDSSALVVLLQELVGAGRVNADIVGPAVKTFSACYPSMRFDEKPYVECLLEEKKLEGYLTCPSGEDVRDVMRQVVECQEEPFGSTGILSQWFVFRLAHEHRIKVMLDGQGADELFAGYLTFFVPLLREHLRRRQYGQLLAELLAVSWHYGCYPFTFWPVGQARTVLQRFARPKTASAREKQETTCVPAPGWLRTDAFPAGVRADAHPDGDLPRLGHALNDARAGYLLRFSLPSLLRYEDKNSMHFSIESRLPYLDPRLVEFAFSLPAEAFLHRGTTKRILREAVQDIVPRKILRRRVKLGFATPEADWHRGPLRPILEDVFYSPSFAARGFFNVEVARSEWKRFLAGGAADPSVFWRWANLELWFRRFVD